MIASVSVIVTPLAILLFLAFLALLALLAVVASRATRGPEDGRRGCLGGCGLFLVILLLCGLAIAGFVAFVVTLTGVTAIEHNPIRDISVHVPELPNTEHGEYKRGRDVPILIRVETDGDHENVIPGIRRFLERRFDIDDDAFEHVRTIRTETGTRIEISIPVDARDLENLERELEAWGLELERGLRIELETERST